MTGEIATAYLGITPTMRGFGSTIVQQGGTQIAAAGRQLGAKGGQALGMAMGGSAAKSALPALGQVNAAVVAAQSNTNSWLTHTAQMAAQNVVLYGSMFLIINSVKDAISSTVGTMVNFNAELEQAEIGFTTLLGSASAARDQMQWIKDFAKETPFGYHDLVRYSQQLVALGFNSEQARDVLQATGDAAAALGRGSESIARINLALGQMWTKGKVQSQEMLQLTEAGIGAWQILAEAYGVSVAEVQDAVTKGLITASDAVPALIEGMNARFGGLMEKQSETYAGVLSNIQDTIEQQLATAGEPLFRVLTVQAQQFLDALDDPEVVELMGQLGEFLAGGAKALSEVVRVGWQWRDVILAAAVGYAALRTASSWSAKHFSLEAIAAREATVAWRAMPTALTGVKSAQAAATAANQAAVRASLDLAVAKRAEAQASVAAAQAAQLSATGTAGSAKIAEAAQKQLNIAKNESLAANARLIASENAAAAATERATAAVEARRAAMARLAPLLSSVGSMAGAMLLFDGFARASDQAKAGFEDVGQSALGMAEAIGGGALAGAALGTIFPGLGTMAGAVGGAVVGLAGSLWQMSEAMNAANADTTAATAALQKYGVEATLASLALEGITNDQLEALGGFTAIRESLLDGGFSEYVAGLEQQSRALHEQADALREKQAAMEAANEAEAGALGRSKEYQDVVVALKNVTGEARALDDAIAALAGNADYFVSVQEQMVFAAYQAAYASDMQAGAVGRAAEAAWQAVIANGGLSTSALTAQLRAEALAGAAGFATEMITGIPANTPINFSSNANDILTQIIQLRSAAEAGFSDLGMTADGYVRRMQQLQDQYAAALRSTSVRLSIPASVPSSTAGRAASTASKAADDAARKLQQDRQAQLRFGDAFGALMESALAGKFDQYRDRLEDQIVSLAQNGYKKASAALKEHSTILTQSALDYAALINKLEAASDAYDDLTGRMRDQYNASRDQILSLGAATDAQSFDQLLYLLGETTSAATQYQDVLTQLKERGLAESVWNQLAQAGPESMALAQSILAQGDAGIEQLNSVSAGLLDAADSMGELVSESMYQQGVDAMQAYIEGLKSQSAALESQLVTIANNVLNKTAGAITPGNAGYSPITGGPTTTANTYQVSLSVNASDFGDLQSIQAFIAWLESAPTTQLVDAAGTVVS